MKKIFILLICNIFGFIAHAQSEEIQTLGYICEGTRWESFWLKVYPIFNDKLIYETKVIKDITWIEGTETINGRTYMKVYRSTEAAPDYPPTLHYIRVEGERVYLHDDDLSGNKEYLIYDYSLSTGETLEIDGCDHCYVPEDKNYFATNQSKGTLTFGNNTYETMDMMILYMDYNANTRPDETITWIKGIGSEAGLLENWYSPRAGGNILTAVYHNDVMVYKAQTTGIENIYNDMVKQEKTSKKYHIDGTEFKDGDTGICIEADKKTIRF